MAKVKARKSEKSKPVVIVDASGAKVTEISPRYKMIPVDFETYQDVMHLCEVRGLNRRSQGALVKSLVKAELGRVPIK